MLYKANPDLGQYLQKKWIFKKIGIAIKIHLHNCDDAYFKYNSNNSSLEMPKQNISGLNGTVSFALDETYLQFNNLESFKYDSSFSNLKPENSKKSLFRRQIEKFSFCMKFCTLILLRMLTMAFFGKN